jgi:propanol-preferring alcohol dehydrogenase
LYKPQQAKQWAPELATLPMPEPCPGKIGLSVRVCGVCHTDLHTVEGDLASPRLPLVPGRQVVGMVEIKGDGVTRSTEGQRSRRVVDMPS